MPPLYPLRFEPILRQYVWGGRRLGSQLGKPIGEGDHYAESWEIADRAAARSRLIAGALAGETLSRLIDRFGPQLLGQSLHERLTDPLLPENLQRRFPLIFKFLDAQQTLSVQVHPDDDLAMLTEPADLGKTEAWYVLDADPGAKLFVGLQPGVGPEQLADAAMAGNIERLLHSFEPLPGDCVMIPAGTVHAIGGGLLIAEIQQASDTTFRLYDWGRSDTDGRPRALHLDEGVHATDYRRGPIQPNRPQPTDRPDKFQLASCDKFVMNLWRIEQPVTLQQDDQFRMVSVVQGAMELEGDPHTSPLQVGDTALLPACLSQVTVRPLQPTEFLEIHVPRGR